MKHSNVAIFVPHNGCPHQCSFCNQKSIVGQVSQPSAKDVKVILETAVNSLKENSVNAEIAFFGGSFTAIDRTYMLELLEATAPFIDKFKGIRISTRPDCIDDEILLLLKKYNVTSIELGAQSMDDDVLLANNRGHSEKDVYVASMLIKSYGFSLGLQMMTGLYKSSFEKDVATAEKLIEIKPDTVRIYPTIVMKNTQLERLYYIGEYEVMDTTTAVELCARLLKMFSDNGISVIRLGLHHSESLDTDKVAGPYHPAFRELCESEILFYNLIEKIELVDAKNQYVVRVCPGCVSKLVGNNKSNLKRLNELGYNIKIIQDSSVKNMEVVLEN